MTAAAVTLFLPDFASVRVIACSPPSWMVQVALREKRVAYDQVTLDFAKGEHKTPEMLAKNPRGTVPVLEHDGAVVHETFAILQYIDDVIAGPALLPKEPRARASALSRWHETTALKTAGMALFGYLMRTPEDERDDRQLGDLATALEMELDYWNAAYERRVWLADAFSLADISVLAYVATAAQLGHPFGSALPYLGDFLARARGRPSVTDTWPRMWGTPAAAPPWPTRQVPR